MAVKIRLKRMGAKKRPFYRIVVADERAPRDGRIIETVGTYDSNVDPAVVKIDEEKALSWMMKGAQPTDTVRSMFSKEGLMTKLAGQEGCEIRRRPMKEIVEVIAKAIVNHPSEVQVEEERRGSTVVLKLHVAPDDMGKVIGKQGRIAKAIRMVMKAAATRENVKVIVDID